MKPILTGAAVVSLMTLGMGALSGCGGDDWDTTPGAQERPPAPTQPGTAPGDDPMAPGGQPGQPGAPGQPEPMQPGGGY